MATFSYHYSDKQGQDAQKLIIEAIENMAIGMGKFAGYLAERAIVLKDSSKLAEIVNVIKGEAQKRSCKAWLTQANAPFELIVGGSKAGGIKFSERKAKTILGLAADAKLTEDNLHDLARAIVIVYSSTRWDAEYTREKREKREKKKAEKAEEAEAESRENTQSSEGFVASLPDTVKRLLETVLQLSKVNQEKALNMVTHLLTAQKNGGNKTAKAA
jgi:hypothetical protein